MRRPSLLALGLALAGCALEPIDLGNRRCPCIEGWVCDEARDRCVEVPEGGAPDARPIDASVPRDARIDGGIDAARIDSAIEDASAIDDAGAIEDGEADATEIDAACDACS